VTPERAVVAYRYGITDIDKWTDETVHVFYRRINRNETAR
jgi:hypothetical protein